MSLHYLTHILEGMLLVIVLLIIILMTFGGERLTGKVYVLESLMAAGAVIFVSLGLQKGHLLIVRGPMHLIFLLLIIGGLCQCVPLPVSWVNFLAPQRLVVARTAMVSPHAMQCCPLSLYPAQTFAAVMKLGAYYLFFLLACVSCRQKQQRQIMIVTLIAVALVNVLDGLNNHLQGQRVSGSFVNPNILAAILIMTAPLIIGQALGIYLRSRRRHFWQALRRGKRSPVLFSLLLLVFLFVEVCLVLTMSLGGLLANLFSFLVFLSGLRLFPRLRGYILPLLLVSAATIGIIALSEGPALSQRLEQQLFAGQGWGRWEIWRSAAQIVRDFPWTGTGLATGKQAYYRYTTAMLEQEVNQGYRYLYHAHNDYLQFMSTLGLPLSLLLGLLLSWLGMGLIGRLCQLRSSAGQALCLGALSGILALMLQSMVRFNFRHPAIMTTLLCLWALAVTGLHKSQRHTAFYRPLLRRTPGIVLLVATLMGAGWYTWSGWCHYQGQRYFEQAGRALYKIPGSQDTPEREVLYYTALLQIKRALHYNPRHAAAWRRQGDILTTGYYYRLGTLASDLLDQIVHCYQQALHYEPTDFRALQALAWHYWMIGFPSLGDDYMQRGLAAAPHKGAACYQAARYWLQRSLEAPSARTAQRCLQRAQRLFAAVMRWNNAWFRLRVARCIMQARCPLSVWQSIDSRGIPGVRDFLQLALRWQQWHYLLPALQCLTREHGPPTPVITTPVTLAPHSSLSLVPAAWLTPFGSFNLLEPFIRLCPGQQASITLQVAQSSWMWLHCAVRAADLHSNAACLLVRINGWPIHAWILDQQHCAHLRLRLCLPAGTVVLALARYPLPHDNPWPLRLFDCRLQPCRSAAAVPVGSRNHALKEK